MAAVGIDFGTEKCVVAMARKGGVDIMCNEMSNRWTPTLVGFSDTRVVGEAATSLITMSPKNVVTNIKETIGMSPDNPGVDLLTPPRVPISYSKNKDELVVSVMYNGESRSFSTEQVLSMLFSKLAADGSAYFKTSACVDCVISVPAFFTMEQRVAVRDAAKIAGLNVLSLLSESAAIALEYGIYKVNLPTDKPVNAIFFEFGARGIVVSVVRVTKNEATLVGQAWDQTIGGQQIDELFTELFVDRFQRKFKKDLRSNPRGYWRMRKAAQRAKHVLSTNESAHVNVEMLLGEYDFMTTVNRQDLISLVQPMLDRIPDLIAVALKEALIEKSDLSFAEIVGGSTRIPAVQQVLSRTLGMELSRTLNSDECVAKGCAWMAAMISPQFRVRDFNLHDRNPQDVYVTYPSSDGMEVTKILFARGQPMPKKVKLSVVTEKAFSVSISLEGEKVIGSFSFTDVRREWADGHFAIAIRFELRRDGSVAIVSAESVEERAEAPVDVEMREETPAAPDGQVDAPVEKEVVMEDALDQAAKAKSEVKEEEGTPMQADEASPAEAEAAKEEVKVDAESSALPEAFVKLGKKGMEEKAEPVDESSKKEKKASEKAGKGKSKPADKKEEKPKKPKKIVKRSQLKMVERPAFGVSKKKMDGWIVAESKMLNHDGEIFATASARNSLETYVYDMQRDINDKCEAFIVPKAKEGFLAELSEMEDWIYGDGENQPRKVFEERLKKLQEVGDPVMLRWKESTAREEAAQKLRKTCVDATRFSESKADQHSHIEAKDRAKIVEKAQTVSSWLETRMEKQSKEKPYGDLVLLSSDILLKAKELETFALGIMNKPKPIPKKEKKKNDKKDKKDKKADKDEKKGAKAEEKAGEATGEVEKDSAEGEAVPMEESSVDEPRTGTDGPAGEGQADTEREMDLD